MFIHVYFALKLVIKRKGWSCCRQNWGVGIQRSVKTTFRLSQHCRLKWPISDFLITVWTAQIRFVQITFICGPKSDTYPMFCNTTSVWTAMSHFMRFLRHWNATDVTTELSVSPAPLSYCCSLGQTNRVAHCLNDSCSENLVPSCFCTILDTEGHQMGIKYSMEGFITYLTINTVGNWKRGFIDHNTSVINLILRSRMITCRINTVHVSQRTITLIYI